MLCRAASTDPLQFDELGVFFSPCPCQTRWALVRVTPPVQLGVSLPLKGRTSLLVAPFPEGELGRLGVPVGAVPALWWPAARAMQRPQLPVPVTAPLGTAVARAWRLLAVTLFQRQAVARAGP